MTDCRDCRFAKWDYEDYYNCPDPQWFVCGCIKDMDAYENEGYECEEYEENRCE